MSAQTVTVRGTVSTAFAYVRNASVSFASSSSPGTILTAQTDSIGHYQLTLNLTSVPAANTLPAKFELAQNYPNPFSASTVIPYALNAPTSIKVTIFDILGRVVREMSAGIQSSGTHSILWDGTNGAGHKIVPGVYFYCLQAGGEVQTKKMVFRGGNEGVASLPLPYSLPMSAASPGLRTTMLSEGTFTVTIDTTGTTSPRIVPLQINNVVIQGDTTLDYVVADQVQIVTSTLATDSVQQVIRGFGAANILPWRPDMTPDEVQAAFGSGPGQCGFSILRLRIPYTDNVSEFSANLPTAQLAQSLGAIVFATPWTPPPAMKTSDSIVAGSLFDSSYASYALHLKSFADYMASNGVPLYAVSIQNEPDARVTYESCAWNATQFLKFVKNNAGTIGTRIMMPESESFVHALSDSTLNDPTAAAHVAIIGGHIYGGGLGPYPLAVSKGKDVWMTEHLVTDTSWTAVLGTGTEMHNCLSAGMNAYVWWYIVRYYGPIGEDGSVTKRGFVMSQYARFVRPGYVKIYCTAAPQRNIWISAYKSPSSAKVVIVALNVGSSPIQQGFVVANGHMASFTPYTTTISKNCQQGTDVPAVNGGFAVTLEPSSITTFVSN